MFTGLVEDIGTIHSIQRRGEGRQLWIETALPTSDILLGASIAVQGVCLTAEELQPGRFRATAGRETLACSTAGQWQRGQRVHLEQALRLSDRLGGHLVQGHVDGLGEVESLTQEQESWLLWVRMPRELEHLIAVKGAICIDGVSLTVNEIRGQAFRVNVIPHTAEETLLGRLRAGERVNLEVDLLARYVERMLQGKRPEMSLEWLRSLGY